MMTACEGLTVVYNGVGRTAAKLIFTGLMTNEYRTQMNPVAVRASYCEHEDGK